tara:strand:+ start:85 stop:4755 length:4671 start_codon:yes stop_codon:yes gene_type:complete
MSNNNFDSGDFRYTPPIIQNTNMAGQKNLLTYQSAPRNTEEAQTTAGPNDNQYFNLSYRRSLNSSIGGPYNRNKINPIGFQVTQRAEENPYFLFMGKFATNSQLIQNTNPNQVGHVDISGMTINQQPSNIYNIPDVPKPYTLIQSNEITGFYPNDYYKSGSQNSNFKIVYDASGCPVNWRIFGPIQQKVIDLSNGVLNAGLYDISLNGDFDISDNPMHRKVNDVYFDITNFDVSFNPQVLDPSGAPRAFYRLQDNIFINNNVNVGNDIILNGGNIYNIPDTPVDITLNGFTYDASYCPVNWNVFEDLSANVSNLAFNANSIIDSGLFEYDNNGQHLLVNNPQPRDVSGIFFDTDTFDVSFNIAGTSNTAFVSLKQGTGGGGTGTDISFNDYFFKQPGMPLDCNCVLQTTPTLQLKITWDKPFNRLSGTTNRKQGVRYFYKENQLGTNNFVENWLPEFTELVLDISGGPTNRKFCKDASGNFVHKNGGGVLGSSNEAYALLSANNTTIQLQGNSSGSNPASNTVTNQWDPGSGTPNPAPGQFSYGISGQTTTILNGIPPLPNVYSITQNVGGGLGTGVIQPANTYDIALYYRNNSLIKTDVSQNDLYYNKHNVCLFENQILGQPGLLPAALGQLIFWNSPTGSRTYFGGEGPASKDQSLNIPWNNTSIVSVGYDCSFSFISNSGVTAGQDRVQVNGINARDLSYNNMDILYNLDTTQPTPYPPLHLVAPAAGDPDTRQFWPHPSTSATNGTPTSAYDYIKIIDELSQNVVPGKQHPEYKYEGTNYNGLNSTSPLTQRSGTGATKVIPILPRADCNLTNNSDYESAMTNAISTSGWCEVDISNNGSVVTNNIQATICRKRQTAQTQLPVYFVPSGSTLYINTGNDTFRQLANHGDPKINPSDQTYSELVDADSFIGTKAKNTLLGKVELEISNVDANFTNKKIDSEVYGWDNNESLTWTNNPINGAQEVDTTYKLKFDKSASFDVAENDPLTNYSDKRGYYLGFDINNVSVELDLNGGTYKDVALYGYNPYILKLNHIIEKDLAASTTTTKEFEFNSGKTPPNAITITNIAVNTHTNGASNSFQDWFGIKRLPAASTNNSHFGTPGLELSLSFDLNNVHEYWIPRASQFNGTLVKAEFVYDPDGTKTSFTLNNNNTDDVKWTADCVSGTSSTTISFTGATGNPTDTNPSPFYVELHEGKKALVGTNGTGDGKYSRSVTEATPNPKPLFGIKDNKIECSNNVTLTPQTITDTSVNNSQFKFGPGLGKELFFDYTWPVNTSKLPVSLSSNINTQVELLNLPTLTTTGPWGKTGNPAAVNQICRLPELGPLTATPNPAYSTLYNHTAELNNSQAMWCNKSFVGSNYLGSGVNNPYIDYGTYFDQGGGVHSINYQLKGNLGSEINLGGALGITNRDTQVFPIAPIINETAIKWILLSLKSTLTGNNSGNTEVELKYNGTALDLVDNYLLFYCEYKQSAFTVDGSSSDYSTWLNAISNSVPSASSIKSIDTAQTSGGNNGCWDSGTKDAPVIRDLAVNAPNKYILIGLLEGEKIDTINITKVP